MMTDETNVNELGLKSFELAPEQGGTQVILAHKQISAQEHLVFTHGDNENDRLKCFKLSHLDGERFRAIQLVQPEAIAEAARLLGMDDRQI